MKVTRSILFVLMFAFFAIDVAFSQTRTVPTSQQFRLGEGLVRIAEPGQLTDTLSVWGDINAPGRYLVPRGTRPHELISYARGPISVRTGETILDWSKLRLEITISRYNGERRLETIENFQFRYNEEYPEGLRNFTLANDDILSVEVKRKPAFVDYVRVIAPIVSTLATSIIIIDRL
ncbi:MAG: hypothetical protein ACNA78_11015 [Balneolaceae bacterium]